ncbi:MAG: protein kinase domain-containing protein, partial [Thermoanaerobaculia bacterium]
MADPFPKTIGKYEVLSVIGRGGMGIVYKAHDPIIGRIVAIKTISVAPDLKPEELSRRLQMEAQSAGRLQHPNIATIYDFGTLGDMPYIVLEYVEGTDLARVIETGVELTLHQKFNVLVDVAHGLAYAHELDVVHRDMKPSNVRLTNRCVAKIIDFGLARFDSTRLTRTGFMSGTIAYMSPERIHGTEGPSDDIFALGVIAYELLTYQRAFPGSTPPEVIMKIISQTPPPPSAIAALPPELDPIIMKGLARETGDRYATAAEFADALDAFRHSDEMRAFTRQDVRRTSPGRPMAASLTLPGDHDEANVPTHVELRADENVPTEIDARIAPPGAALPGASGDMTDADKALAEPVEDPASAPTRIERVLDGRGRRRVILGGALAAFVVAATIAGALLLPRTVVSPPADPAPIATGTSGPLPPATAPAGESPANSAIESDVRNQRLLLSELQNDLAVLRLDDDERARFRRAEEMGDLAEAKYRENSLEESTRILSETIG